MWSRCAGAFFSASSTGRPGCGTSSAQTLNTGAACAVGSTPVSVVNAADLAKAQGVQRPFAVKLHCQTDPVDRRACAGRQAVPANQRWVIEYVSMRCVLDGNGALAATELAVQTSPGDVVVHHLNLAPQPVGPYGGFADIGQTVRIYAAAGTPIDFDAIQTSTTGTSGNFACAVTFSGQAIDVP